ncbi:MAG: type VI secretion system ImpA family N-terminal domain-containing protein [Colwellia sp.]|nr:type VI secretion system ImpA family N-terminal domain-containing protein [Colwellia sp.]
MDYKQLLEPIEGDKPSGCYLKDDRTQYRALRNTFNTAQSSFRRFIETPDSSSDEELFEDNQKNWQAVSDACWLTLTEKSKDIEIYCWWAMSLAFQRDSINKVSLSLATLTPFIETFWPDVNPCLPDKKLKSSEESEQASERAGLQLKPLIQLLGESNSSGLLYMPLQMLALVGDTDHAKYLSATKAGTLPKLKAQAVKDFPSCKEDITETINALDLAIRSLIILDDWLKKKMAELSLSVISTQFLKTNLLDCLQAIEYLVKESYSKWPLEQAKQSAVNDKSVVQNTAESGLEKINVIEESAIEEIQPSAFIETGDQALNRDLAFQKLRILADYFAKNEPHSPVSYLLEKAIRWGYMSLPDLMAELVLGNDKVLGQINLVTGISEDKADLPAYSVTAPRSYNNSTGEKVSVINEEASDSKSTTSVALTSVNEGVSSSAAESKENSSDSEFSW